MYIRMTARTISGQQVRGKWEHAPDDTDITNVHHGATAALADPDQVTGLYLPDGGIVLVRNRALETLHIETRGEDD